MKYNFSPDNFKKWMSEHQDEPKIKKNSYLGADVEIKEGVTKIKRHMTIEDGDLENVSKEFKEYGGTVVDIYDNKLLIETKQGKFIIHKVYVQRK